MRVSFRSDSIDDYRRFLAIRKLPSYSFRGGVASFPDEYSHLVDGVSAPSVDKRPFNPSPFLFDYQADISRLAIRKQKYAVFADCGLGKTLIMLEFAQHAANATGKRVLIVSPLMVVKQTVAEALRWHPGIDIKAVRSSELQEWISGRGTQIGVTNYEAIRDSYKHKLGGLILDESSMLKSHYGKWGTRLIEMGRGLDWKLCSTGTPAPNDRIEYANHAVFLDRAKTTNEFLASYFINRGETNNRWELKPHALRPFYRSLSAWSMFLSDPAVYGWSDNTTNIPPINIRVEDVPLTNEQRKAAQRLTGNILTHRIGGIGDRSKLSQIALGIDKDRTPSNKPGFIRDLIGSWEDESTIVWCRFNEEQQVMADALGGCNISGATKQADRERMIDSFVCRDERILTTKPTILGFGLNLQVATRQVVSGIKDSYEEFYQAVKRSNRVGSTRPLNVHICCTELEMPMVENVLAKADRVMADTKEQEELFRESWHGV